jgi:hypothetical protein
MKKFIVCMVAALLSLAVSAGEHDLQWDFTSHAPSASPVNGLTYLTRCADGMGVYNGLNGVKLDSKGYCYFTKAPVKGKLKLYFADRTTNKSTSLKIYTWKGKNPSAQTLIAETGELTEYGLQVIELDSTQNNIYITRGSRPVETVLQKIQFKEGTEYTPELCVVTYRDQRGNELGRAEVLEGTALASIPYGAGDLPKWGADSLFRGWYYLSGKKAKAGDKILSNATIQARVTPICRAEVGTVQLYNLASPTFYQEDEDLLDISGEVFTLRLGPAKTVVKVEHRDGSEKYMHVSNRPTVMFRDNEQSVVRITVYNVAEYIKKDENNCFHIPANDAASFLLAISEANKTGSAVIMLPDGVYDLGQIVLTPIIGHNISIIGQSMEGTIIKNAPDYRSESINRTATIIITDSGFDTYFQDLTIQNDLDYYRLGSGRAVCLWDQGAHTICKRVRLLSYQDTYYSDRPNGAKYFEDCEIHGVVDFICGDGCVHFKNTLLYCEKRNLQNTGVAYITASRSHGEDYGYVFENCTIKSECPTVSFGRAWCFVPQVAFINTLVDYSAGEFTFDDGKRTQRWTKELMTRDAWPIFGEYNTHLANGVVLTPAKNDVEFVDIQSGKKTRELSTVLSKSQAAKFTMDYTLGRWAKEARKKISYYQKFKQ